MSHDMAHRLVHLIWHGFYILFPLVIRSHTSKAHTFLKFRKLELGPISKHRKAHPLKIFSKNVLLVIISHKLQNKLVLSQDQAG